MTISFGALAGLVAAIAFLILVLFTIPVLKRLTGLLTKTDNTVDIVNKTVTDLSGQTTELLKESTKLLEKSNYLLEDVNGKVKELDPVVQAAADLGESVSDINASSKNLVSQFSTIKENTAKIGLVSSLARKLIFRRNRRNK